MDCTKANQLLFVYLNIQNLHDLYRENKISKDFYEQKLNELFKKKETLQN